MQWDYLFSRTELEQGKQYYRSGKAAYEKHWDDVYQMKVKGTSVYTVNVQLRGFRNPVIKCTCPMAAEMGSCKHMVAALYKIEELQKHPERISRPMQQKKRIHPFSNINRNMGDEYHYFDLEHMTDGFVFYEQTFAEAKRIVEAREARLLKVEFGYGNEDRNIVGVARGAVRSQGNDWVITICFSRDAITKAVCHVPGCQFTYEMRKEAERIDGKERLCIHEIAILILLLRYLKNSNPGDSTDRDASSLISAFRSRRAGISVEKSPALVQQICLEPRMEKTGGRLWLSFRIGSSKMVMVKNLTELVKTVENRGILILGTKTQLNFAAFEWKDRSERYYGFVRKVVKEELHRISFEREQYQQNPQTQEIAGNIELYGQRLDEFYTLAEGEYLSYTNRDSYDSVKGGLVLRRKNPEFELSMEQDVNEKGRFQGIYVHGQMPELFEGSEYSYFLENSYLNRISPEKTQELTPLLEIGTSGVISFHVGRKHLSEFYYRVLPRLRENARVEEPDDGEISKYLPPEVVFFFYLDVDKDNVTCRVTAKYGEQECETMDFLKPGRKTASFRDENRERETMEGVQKFFPGRDTEKNLFHCNNDEDVIYQVLESGIAELLKLGEVQSTDAFRRLKIRGRTKFTVGVSVRSNIMDLTITSEDITQEELLDILYSYQRKKKYYRLRNGDFLNLEDENLNTLGRLMEDLHVSAAEFVDGKMNIPTYRALYLDKMLEQNKGLYAQRDSYFRSLIKEFKTVSEADYDVPCELQKIMRNYQIYGHKWLRTLENSGFGGILADEMGLGKTLQIISVILAEHIERKKKGEPHGTSLVICPASLIYNWQEEFRRFAPALTVLPVAGGQKERQELLKTWSQWDVLVTSYDLLKRDVAEYEGKEFLYQVIDEAQYIKNHATAASKSVKVIRSRCRFALTGTPIENRLSELWSIFDYLMPGFLYGYEMFKREIETPIAKEKDEETMKRLKRMVSPFILRRLKSDVLKDLPEKMEEIRYARLETVQQQVYDGQVAHMQEILRGESDESFRRNRIQILAELTRIRQICCDPTLLLENYEGGSAKRDACMELIESAIEGEHKILVFSQFTSMLELLEQDLKERKLSFYKITGATPKEQRMEMVKAFNEDDVPVFLISLKAGGTGLNLTGADVVIHYDPWWNLAVQNQATDRAHRIGQTKVVSVYKLIVKDSIEEKIVKLQESKKDLADEILSGENGNLMNMSREDLLELIR